MFKDLCVYFWLFQAAAIAVAQDVVSMVSKIAELLAEKLQVGDPPVIISLGKMTLHVRKSVASEAVKEAITSHIGSLNIDGQLDVPDTACVVSQVRVLSLPRNPV